MPISFVGQSSTETPGTNDWFAKFTIADPGDIGGIYYQKVTVVGGLVTVIPWQYVGQDLFVIAGPSLLPLLWFRMMAGLDPGNTDDIVLACGNGTSGANFTLAITANASLANSTFSDDQKALFNSHRSLASVCPLSNVSLYNGTFSYIPDGGATVDQTDAANSALALLTPNGILPLTAQLNGQALSLNNLSLTGAINSVLCTNSNGTIQNLTMYGVDFDPSTSSMTVSGGVFTDSTPTDISNGYILVASGGTVTGAHPSTFVANIFDGVSTTDITSGFLLVVNSGVITGVDPAYFTLPILDGATPTDIADAKFLVAGSGVISGIDPIAILISAFSNDADFIDDSYDDSGDDFFVGGETSLHSAVRRIAEALNGLLSGQIP